MMNDPELMGDISQYSNGTVSMVDTFDQAETDAKNLMGDKNIENSVEDIYADP